MVESLENRLGCLRMTLISSDGNYFSSLPLAPPCINWLGSLCILFIHVWMVSLLKDGDVFSDPKLISLSPTLYLALGTVLWFCSDMISRYHCDVTSYLWFKFWISRNNYFSFGKNDDLIEFMFSEIFSYVFDILFYSYLIVYVYFNGA